jgi:hypothetical protein
VLSTSVVFKRISRPAKLMVATAITSTGNRAISASNLARPVLPNCVCKTMAASRTDATEMSRIAAASIASSNVSASGSYSAIATITEVSMTI